MARHLEDLKIFYGTHHLEEIRYRPLFPSSTGDYCTKQGVVQSLRKSLNLVGEVEDRETAETYNGHTFRITGARILARQGLDCITIQLLGHWGSNAILSYLAESPLEGFAERFKNGLNGSSLKEVISADSVVRFENQDDMVNASEMWKEYKQKLSEFEQIQKQPRELKSRVEDQAQSLEGVEVMLDQKQAYEIWTVDSTDSNVRHRAQVDLSSPPAFWKTLCGWSFSSKFHVATSKATFERDGRRMRPRCFPNNADDRTSSSSSSSED